MKKEQVVFLSKRFADAAGYPAEEEQDDKACAAADEDQGERSDLIPDGTGKGKTCSPDQYCDECEQVRLKLF